MPRHLPAKVLLLWQVLLAWKMIGKWLSAKPLQSYRKFSHWCKKTWTRSTFILLAWRVHPVLAALRKGWLRKTVSHWQPKVLGSHYNERWKDCFGIFIFQKIIIKDLRKKWPLYCLILFYYVERSWSFRLFYSTKALRIPCPCCLFFRGSSKQLLVTNK